MVISPVIRISLPRKQKLLFTVVFSESGTVPGTKEAFKKYLLNK